MKKQEFLGEWNLVAEEENKNEELLKDEEMLKDAKLLKDEIKDVQQKKEIIEKNVELLEETKHNRQINFFNNICFVKKIELNLLLNKINKRNNNEWNELNYLTLNN